MRAQGAPEDRSFSYTGFSGAMGSICALGLLLLTPAWMLQSVARAETPTAHAQLRRLAAIPGDVKPGFTLPDLAGSRLKLQEQGGRIVLVHFFATWCEPCREELSSLSRLVEGPLGKRLFVVAVNVAEVPERVRRFLDSGPVRFPVVLDTDRAVTRSWGVSILPTTFVLDPILRPRLFVEGDLDWSRPDILSTLEAVGVGHDK